MSAAPPPLASAAAITQFPTDDVPYGQRTPHDDDEISRRLLTHDRRPLKDAVPGGKLGMWSPMLFGECACGAPRCGRRMHRKNDNVVEGGARINFDIDKSPTRRVLNDKGREVTAPLNRAEMDAVIARLQGLGVRGEIHSSHSYDGAEKCSLRGSFVLDRRHTATEWFHLWHGAVRYLGIPAGTGDLDRDADMISRAWWWPSAKEGAPVFALRLDGAPLQVDAMVARGREARPEGAAAREIPIAGAGVGARFSRPGDFDFDAFIAAHADVLAPAEYGDGYIITCPWSEDHSSCTDGTSSTSVVRGPPHGFSCLHTSCRGARGWTDFRREIDPSYRTLEEREQALESAADDVADMLADQGWAPCAHMIYPSCGCPVPPEGYVAPSPMIVPADTPTTAKVNSDLQAARKRLCRSSQDELQYDGNLLARVLSSDLFVDKNELAHAAIAAWRNTPNNTTTDQIRCELSGCAGAFTDELVQIVEWARPLATPYPADAGKKSKRAAAAAAFASGGAGGAGSAAGLNLVYTEKGEVRQCFTNTYGILKHDPETAGRLRFNFLTKQIEVTDGCFANAGPNELPIAMTLWIEGAYTYYPNQGHVEHSILHVAKEDTYHPVREYLESLVWDGVPRIGGMAPDGAARPSWLSTYCGSARDEHTSRIAAMWLISAVARAYNPGEKVDTVLTLAGPQSFRKSTAFKTLASPAWFSDTPIKLGDKDSYMACSATWIAELAELASIASASDEYEKHKAFLTSDTDQYRPPYGRAMERVGRTAVFCGTTNDEGDTLGDPSGNRRHWFARVTREIDIQALAVARDQLWAEAAWRYKAGLAWPASRARPVEFRWWLEAEEQELANRAISDFEREHPWVDTLVTWLDKQKVIPEDGWRMSVIAEQAFGIWEQDLPKNTKDLAKAFAGAGLHRGAKDSRGRRKWVLRRGAGAPSAPGALPPPRGAAPEAGLDDDYGIRVVDGVSAASMYAIATANWSAGAGGGFSPMHMN